MTGAFDDVKTLIMDQTPFRNDFPKLIDCVLFDETKRGEDGIWYLLHGLAGKDQLPTAGDFVHEHLSQSLLIVRRRLMISAVEVGLKVELPVFLW
jgi:hypothetical protein